MEAVSSGMNPVSREVMRPTDPRQVASAEREQQLLAEAIQRLNQAAQNAPAPASPSAEAASTPTQPDDQAPG